MLIAHGITSFEPGEKLFFKVILWGINWDLYNVFPTSIGQSPLILNSTLFFEHEQITT